MLKFFAGLGTVMTKLRLVLLATTALTAAQFASFPSHAQTAPMVIAQAVLATWLRTIDRQELKGQLLQAPDAKLEEIMARAKDEICNQGRSQQEKDGPMPSPWVVRQRTYFTDEQRRAGRNARVQRCRKKRVKDGKCEKCGKSLDRNSRRECSTHLAQHRQRDARYRSKKRGAS